MTHVGRCCVCGDRAPGLRRYCSDRCKWKARPRIPCSVCGGPTGWLKGSAKAGPNPRCRPCTRASCGTPAAYGRGCRCDDCRAAKAAAMRAYAAKVKARDGISPTQKYRPAQRKTCKICGKPCFRKRGNPEDNLCAACWKVRAARRREAERKAARAAAGTPANPRWPWVQGECRHCGERFVRKGMASPYCSKRCNLRDRPSGGIPISRRERLAIYERDNWTCQLCGEPVDRQAHYLDDWAPTLDHIEPRSAALIPDHSPRNLRTAHRWCNSARGDGTRYGEGGASCRASRVSTPSPR